MSKAILPRIRVPAVTRVVPAWSSANPVIVEVTIRPQEPPAPPIPPSAPDTTPVLGRKLRAALRRTLQDRRDALGRRAPPLPKGHTVFTLPKPELLALAEQMGLTIQHDPAKWPTEPPADLPQAFLDYMQRIDPPTRTGPPTWAAVVRAPSLRMELRGEFMTRADADRCAGAMRHAAGRLALPVSTVVLPIPADPAD